MHFTSIDHERNFGNFMEKANANYNEPDYVAALYLLSSPLLARRTLSYIKRRGIKFPDLFEAIKPWSCSERALVVFCLIIVKIVSFAV